MTEHPYRGVLSDDASFADTNPREVDLGGSTRRRLPCYLVANGVDFFRALCYVQGSTSPTTV